MASHVCFSQSIGNSEVCFSSYTTGRELDYHIWLHKVRRALVAPLALRANFRPTDDEYEGKLIPKNSIIFVPIWALHHDDAKYPEHDEFNPDRYLNHPKLANEYAVSPEYENRDKCQIVCC